MKPTSALLAAALALAAGSVAVPAAATVIFGDSGLTENNHPASGTAQFTLSGGILTVVLTNTSGDTSDQGDTLTGLVFSIAGTQTLSFDMTDPTCGETLGPSSAIWTSGTASNTTDPLCGSWTNDLAASPPIAAEFGVATTGFNGEFNGGSITLGNASPDYGIVGALTFPGSIGGSKFPFIQNALQFTFTVTSGSFSESDISGVDLLFGTAGTAEISTHCEQGCTQQIPEPSPLALLAAGGVLLALGRRRRSA
jgi:hypothetical protein